MLRTQETAFGNLVADIMLYAYQPCISYNIDCSLLCGGTIRSDTIYPPGKITLGDLLEIFPFNDTVVVIRITGKQLWDALESSVSMVPKQEGRFPIVSGLKIEYNPKAEPGSRLRNVWFTERRQPTPMEENGVDNDDDGSEGPGPYDIIGKLDFQKTYTVCTRNYMSSGYDGFTALAQPNTQFVIDDENGILLSTLIRRYFIGLYYIGVMKFNMSCEAKTKEAVLKAAATWKKLAETKREKTACKNISKRNIQDAFLSSGETIKVQGEDNDSSDTIDYEIDSKNNDFIKNWVTVAPMIEDRIVTVDF